MLNLSQNIQDFSENCHIVTVMAGRRLNIVKTECLYGNHLKIPEFAIARRQLTAIEVNKHFLWLMCIFM